MSEHEYTVVLEQEEDGRYSVTVPDLPGCTSMGDTYDEAIANVRDAIRVHVDGLVADGLPVPEPRTRAAAVRVAAA